MFECTYANLDFVGSQCGNQEDFIDVVNHLVQDFSIKKLNI